MPPERSEFRRKQRAAVTLSAVAGLVVLVVGLFAREWFMRLVPTSDDLAARLGFTCRWLAGPGLTLLAGVHVAAGRGFHEDAIDGTRTPKSHYLEIALRYNQNTLEQVALAAIAWLAIAASAPRAALAFIPAMAILFVVGRVTFWIGYLLRPIARAFGMVLTALPTAAAYVYLIAHALP